MLNIMQGYYCRSYIELITSMGSSTRVGVIIGIALLTTLAAILVQQVYAAIEDGAQGKR
jgi:hypothetical protein